MNQNKKSKKISEDLIKRVSEELKLDMNKAEKILGDLLIKQKLQKDFHTSLEKAVGIEIYNIGKLDLSVRVTDGSLIKIKPNGSKFFLPLSYNPVKTPKEKDLSKISSQDLNLYYIKQPFTFFSIDFFLPVEKECKIIIDLSRMIKNPAIWGYMLLILRLTQEKSRKIEIKPVIMEKLEFPAKQDKTRLELIGIGSTGHFLDKSQYWRR